MLIYIDLETTGLEAEDHICAIGLITVEEERINKMSDLVKPPKKIRPDAMAVHHITNEAVKGQKGFKETGTYRWLHDHNIPDNTLIAHNAKFDLEMLQREGFVWQGDVIDTLKCAKHLIEELDQYALQYLRYELQLYQQETRLSEQLAIPLIAHSVLSDALHTMLLHEYLAELADHKRLIELSTQPVLLQKFSFGKYSGRYIEEVAMNDPGYLHWMLNSLDDLDDDLRYSLEHYLN